MRRSEYLFFLVLSIAFRACQVEAQSTGGLLKRTPESVEESRRLERRVTLDVQATDRAGKPLHGLSQEDLTVLDDGHPQTITAFREIEGNDQTSPTEAVLVLDTMNATFQDVVIERQGIEKFLRQNDGQLPLPISIVFLADTGVKINKPSKDGNALAEELKKLQTPIRVISPAQGGDGAQERSQRSLRALQLLAEYERTRSGRKILIWVGPGWPLLSRSTAALSDKDHKQYFNSIVEVTTALRRAHITLDSVAPLNLAQVASQSPLLYEAYLQGVEKPTQADSPNLALQVLAVHSGGLVLGQSGDLSGQIALCTADGKYYYEITFDAPEDDAAIRYHALQVKLDQKGAAVRTSTEYYAGVPQSTAAPPTATSTAPPSIASAPKAIQAEARLVIVDVTAVDKNGLPVKGLTSSNFQLKEDKNTQTIVSLEEHDPSDSVTAAAPIETAGDGALVASNKLPTGTVWNVVLIDLFNTAKEDRGRLQSQVEQFLKQLPEHEPLALVTMLGRIKIETSFQDGAGAAYRYLHKNGLGPLDASTPANIVGRPGQDVLMPSADTNGTSIVNQANVDVDRQAYRAQTTLDCFSALAQWLAPYPGRKNVYWLSDGFPLQGRPFGVAGFNADTKGDHPLPMQQKTDKELESARVAIYPVDARGVAAPNADGVTNADSTYEDVGIATALDNNLVAAQWQEMFEIAKATGGTAQFNNDIAHALRNDFTQANTYYTIAYTPPDKEWKGAYHRIELSVDKPGTKLVYREGYYARSAESALKPAPEKFRAAMRLDAPAEMAVQFTSKITKSGDVASVESAVEPKTVDFQQDGSGQFLTGIDFAIMEYDAKGKMLESSLIKLSGKMTPEQVARLSSKTLTGKQTIQLKPGATTLVLGVRDNVSGRFGKVEVPLAKQ